MLQTQSVYPTTLALLKKLMQFEPLNQFTLVGGTALALYRGHRISVDLDLFTETPFDKEQLKEDLSVFFKDSNIEWRLESAQTIIAFIDDIKVDIIKYPYPKLKENVADGIRLISTGDISAMKVSAIAHRGSKKDFFDLYELLEIYSLEEILSFFSQKMPNSDTSYIIRSLTYFDDAEVQENPIMIKSYTWELVKEKIRQVVEQYVKSQL